ncbi:MAG: hypothetical protein SNF33_05125 [Candidatus Algichlamydia australiensis]|nr:hypothetical protein [Chlamydiales bacterium]
MSAKVNSDNGSGIRDLYDEDSKPVDQSTDEITACVAEGLSYAAERSATLGTKALAKSVVKKYSPEAAEASGKSAPHLGKAAGQAVKSQKGREIIEKGIDASASLHEVAADTSAATPSGSCQLM